MSFTMEQQTQTLQPTAPVDWTVKQDEQGQSNEENGQNKLKRKRILRACDACNTRRMKCNGEQPCQRCQDPSACTYDREVKKRGKPPSSLNAQSSVPFTVRFAQPKEPASATNDTSMWTPSTASAEGDNPLQHVRTRSIGEGSVRRPSMSDYHNPNHNPEGLAGNDWRNAGQAEFTGQLRRWNSHSSVVMGE